MSFWSGRANAPLCRLLAVAAMLLAGSLPGSLRGETLSATNAIMRFDAPEQLPATRKVVIGLHKAMIVELPVDAKDVILSHPDTVDSAINTPRRIVLFAKTLGKSNAFFLGANGRKLLVLDISVQHDLTDLSEMLRTLLPGSRLKVSAPGEGIVISGRVARAADAGRAEEIAKEHFKGTPIVNMITVAEKEQVLLKITVAEIQREAIRRLGVNLPAAIASSGNLTFAKVIQNGFPVSSLVATSAGFVGADKVPLVAAGSALQVNGTWGGNSATALIESFERAGLSRTLAEPTLTAISGETAKFLAGGEFPVPIANQNNTLSVTWKSFGVNVSFTPFVLAEGRINLKVSAEVSELSSQGAVAVQGLSIPAVQVRRAETAVEMPSGSALAMAGLLSDQTRQSVDGVPELRNLPVLGALFRSKDYRSSQSELVILVTPYIVRPNDPDSLSRPDEGFAPETDLQGLLRGTLHRIYKPSGKLASSIGSGDVGFIIEYPEHGLKE
jgi:pilus assembly protein CpaC